tara:strand:- start:895 stop:1605 length:711 start_codon:yes stop_codon:yes gene_type:complete
MKEIQNIKDRLPLIKKMGYVRTMRKGNTGVGYTFEELFGVEENNSTGADLNGMVEFKASRKGASSRTTGFCQSLLWNYRVRDVIRKYGWRDKEKPERINFYPSLKVGAHTPGGLTMKIGGGRTPILTVVDSENEELASIPLSVIAFRFKQKLDKLLLVYADTKKIDRVEHFHYNEAYLCQKPSVSSVLKLLRDGKLVVEPRCYIDTNTGKLRDRGVAFRLSGAYLKDLYSSVNKIL